MRLYKNCYTQVDSYKERRAVPIGLFGLRSGQVSPRPIKIFHNAGWYNHLGQKLGWGDLSSRDIRRIAYGIRRDECFIVLSERDSHWRYAAPLRHDPPAPGDELEPGAAYVIQNSQMVILPRRVLSVHRFPLEEKSWEILPGFSATYANPDDVSELLEERGLLLLS